MKIVKMRVGKVLDLTTNELLYNVVFTTDYYSIFYR